MSDLRSSEVVTLVELLPFSWDDLSAGSQLESVLTDPVPVSEAVSAQLIVRVHQNALSTEAGAGVSFVLDRISHRPDEPDVTFVDPTPMATVALDSADGVGTAKLAELRWPLPSEARLRMVATQADRSVEDNSVRVSVALLLHDDEVGCVACRHPQIRTRCGCS